MRVLCRLGVHDWSNWSTYGSRWRDNECGEGEWYTKTVQVRTCNGCSKLQRENICGDLLPGYPVHAQDPVPDKAPLGLDD